MPLQTDLLTRMVGSNPYSKKGRSPIGPEEGLILSDVRLHMAIVLKVKNAYVFRGDAFGSHVKASSEQLNDLAKANSFVKLRYLSEERLKNLNHLQFLLHAVDAIAELGEGQLIYDMSAEKLMTRSELQSALSASVDVRTYEHHVNFMWIAAPEGGIARTFGMEKIGRNDLMAEELATDQQVLAVELLHKAVQSIWNCEEIPRAVSIEAFGDQYQVKLGVPKKNITPVKILRFQTS